jgi:hypothetical protein
VPWREIVTETIAVVDRSPAANVPALRRAETRAAVSGRPCLASRDSHRHSRVARRPEEASLALNGVGSGAHPLCNREPGCAGPEASREPACFCDKAPDDGDSLEAQPVAVQLGSVQRMPPHQRGTTPSTNRLSSTWAWVRSRIQL